MYLPVLLCFLPLIALNLAYSFLTGIDHHWRKQEQKELGQQEVEALAAGADFTYQFSRHAGAFVETFKSLAANGLKPDQLVDNLKKRSDRIFSYPFPEYELFVFRIPETGAADLLHAHTQGILVRRALIRSFEYLVRVNRNETISANNVRQNEAILTGLLGNEAKSEIMAKTQRGRPTFAFYKFFPHFFLWDYFEAEGHGTFGFFLLTRSEDSVNASGKLLALKDLKEQRIGYGAFIPLFAGFGGTVFQSPLQKSIIFRDWIESKVSLSEEDIKKWLQDGMPPITELGNYIAFSFLGRRASHLSVLLLPAVPKPETPLWLFLVNVFAGGALVLLLLRGLILGLWPNVSLKWRFTLTYFLAATLPVSMLLISAYGYVMQYRRSNHFEAVSQLQFCIRQFDARKAQILDEYRAAFAEVVVDKELHEILKARGGMSEQARERVFSLFKDRPQPLPLLSFAIMDEVGEGVRFYGGHSKAEADPTFEAFKFPLVSILRNKMQANNPAEKLREFKPTGAQRTAVEAYNSMSGNDLISEIDRRRSFAITRQVGGVTATQMHELIKIDGLERFVIFIVWDDQALDEKTFRHTVDYFGLNNPGFSFTAYRVTPQGLSPLFKPNRHTGAGFHDKSRSLAELASFRGSYAIAKYDNFSLVALPSKKYYNTIIAGGTQHFDLEQAVGYRLLILGLILCLALVVVIWCGYLSNRLFLDPIVGLEAALRKVSSGKLDIEIISDTPDELGQLCGEFTNMARGLREREKLATLISDHAVEAIAKLEVGGEISDTSSFEGVAMVSDIRNFTGMCEQYPPHVVTELLNEHFAEMTRIISEHGGRIYKFIGDAIEAVFPEEPEAEASASERAFNAASLMIVKLMQINRRRGKNKLFRYQIGVGLAQGTMFSGSIGSLDTRLDYAIIGEPLKKAALLESYSRNNPAFPLIVDEGIALKLRNRGLRFARTGDSAFMLEELGNIPEFSAAGSENADKEKSAAENAEESAASSEKDQLKIEAGQNGGLNTAGAFVFGAVFIALVIGSFVWGNDILHEAQLKSQTAILTAENIRLIEQLKCEKVEKIAFENQCRRLQLMFEGVVGAGNLNDASLPEKFEKTLLTIREDAGRPSRSLVFFYPPFNAENQESLRADVIYNKGFAQSSLPDLTKLAIMRRYVDVPGWKARYGGLPENFARHVFGDKFDNSVFLYEFMNRTAEVSIDGNAEYLFCDYILRDGERVGLVMFTAQIDQLKGSPQLLADGYSDAGRFVVIRSGHDKLASPDSLPADLKDFFASAASDSISTPVNYVINEDKFIVEGVAKTLIVAAPTNAKKTVLRRALLPGAVLAGLVLFFAWFRVVTGRSPINRSIAAKLWLTLLVAAVTPLITVFFVSELYLLEDYNARISQEKNDLQRFIDLFELRDSFSTPVGWKMVKDWTFSPELAQMVSLLNNASGSAEVEQLKVELKKMTDSWHTKAERLDRNVFNFLPRDIAMAGKGGWNFASSGAGREEATQFGNMLGQIARSIIRRRSERLSMEDDGAKEMAGSIMVETALQTVRSMFGDDSFIKLSHGLGLPILLDVLSGTVGIVIYPVPSIRDPEFIIVWMVLLDYDGFLNRVARNYRGAYKILPVEAHRYGNVFSGLDSKFRHSITSIAAMISSSNLPIARKINYDDQDWLVEGRPGVAQITSMLIAMAPEKPIRSAIEHNRTLFNALLLISLLLILLIARNVAADILVPVAGLMEGMRQAGRENYAFRLQIERSDELGVLCSSFDSMMKGLEEKMLMGRMLSKAALKVSLHERTETSDKAEYVIVYIGIPDFTTWAGGMPVGQLMGDLKSHVTSVSRLLMQHGGDIDKIIGDKILAVFNSEVDRKVAVTAACRAASEILNAEKLGNLTFPVAIGMNCGEVITGFLGVGEKRDFTIIGDAVNTAARIAGQAEKLRFGRCLISQNVYEILPGEFLAREYGEIELKGKTLPLKVFQLTGADRASG